MFRPSDKTKHSSEDEHIVHGSAAGVSENSKINNKLAVDSRLQPSCPSNTKKEQNGEQSSNSNQSKHDTIKEDNSVFDFLKTFPREANVTSGEDSPPLHIKLLSCNDDLLSVPNNNSKDNFGKLGSMLRTSPKPASRFPVETDPLSEHSEFMDWSHDVDVAKVVSFRVKKTLPEDAISEPMEMQHIQTTGECTFEVMPVEIAAYPTDEKPIEMDEDDDLIDWWKTVEGWSEWNEAAHFQKDDLAVEAAADRVFMAARLFVSLFNQRGASLQRRVVELLALADTADSFHKKTVSAAVGGGVACVAGGIATITGLILAPFTFGTSTIVTAVGISVATAGSITSATANITDAVQSKMDRKKVEKMIQDYQNEIDDIKDCLEFMQEGINTLQEWNFKEYFESLANSRLQRNIKHVVKEGGRAGKALMINTEKLIGTVKVLGVAGGAAQAAKAISITTGVVSALFLALDVFFLAKDSNELRKGAKTKFASKIREVCRELQHGLLELNKVKTQLQKTMDGIEVEEYDNQGEVEDDDQDPIKLAQLEQELDQLEEKLEWKVTQMNNSDKGETKKKGVEESSSKRKQ
ncbi:apolipoprotein L3 [Triplophysa dalaica]|uniref:apolipoprotein L3 n=1 Tax=Triplophysa dalaica TaxID=1582913 RepID=UPI0024DF8A0F|nr:apolipoprotein L3 [Triplophysa dalaica]XP_056598548.1 apolipoprotein L3 [Triplophysa dalaica]